MSWNDVSCIVDSGYNVSRETLEKLKIYQKLLMKWQKTINLVSRGTLEKFWIRHVLDSLQIIEHINGTRVLDIGSGGGFPGMIIAICSNFDVSCVDSDSRKMIFLEEVARLTDTKVNLKTIRIENFDDCCFDTVCARGFSSLTNLIELTRKHSKQHHGVFLKGAKISQEILDAQKYYNFEHRIVNSKTDNSGRIAVIDNIIVR